MEIKNKKDLYHAIRLKNIHEARRNDNAFREFFIKDDKTGNSIMQEAIHKSWIEHIYRCKVAKKHCAILSCWGHGKSVQIAIAETLRIIGKNQEVRIKIINSSDEYAMDRVKTIKNYIEYDENFQAVYPKVKKDSGQQWTDHRIYVQRKSKAIDPTVEARGILSVGVGGRADVLIFDDPIDERSIHSEQVRLTIREKYQNLWVPRLVDDGFVYYICTRWAQSDLTKTIIESGSYMVLIQRVSEDFEYIEQEIVE